MAQIILTLNVDLRDGTSAAEVAEYLLGEFGAGTDVEEDSVSFEVVSAETTVEA